MLSKGRRPVNAPEPLFPLPHQGGEGPNLDLSMTLLAIFIALVFLHSLVSGRLERTVVTAPILFTTAGLLILLLLPDPSEPSSAP